MLAKRIWLRRFCSLISIAMTGKMKANPGSGRIWNILATHKMAAPEIGGPGRIYLPKAGPAHPTQ